MAKVLEGPGMGLMKKWGINVPNYVVVTSVDELTKLKLKLGPECGRPLIRLRLDPPGAALRS